MSNIKWYTLDQLDDIGAKINFVYGERGNGKTQAVLERILKNWCESGKQGIYLRREDMDIMSSKMQSLFSSIVIERDLVRKFSGGEWEGVTFYRRAFYLTKKGEKGETIKQETPFCFTKSISGWHHDKGGTEPGVTTLCFDEFIAYTYLTDEVQKFAQALSTIVRHRDDLTIYFLGNTLTKHGNKYFRFYGIKPRVIKNIQPGEIMVHEFETKNGGKTKLVTHFASSDPEQKVGKPSDIYYPIEDSTALMIMTGAWDVPHFPNYPFKEVASDDDILDRFYVFYEDEIVQGDIIQKEDGIAIYFHDAEDFHRDTDSTEHMFYTTTFSAKLNHQVGIHGKPKNKLAHAISKLFSENLVFFETNDHGDIIRSYMNETRHMNAINL